MTSRVLKAGFSHTAKLTGASEGWSLGAGEGMFEGIEEIGNSEGKNEGPSVGSLLVGNSVGSKVIVGSAVVAMLGSAVPVVGSNVAMSEIWSQTPSYKT